MSITKPREVFSLPNVHYALIDNVECDELSERSVINHSPTADALPILDRRKAVIGEKYPEPEIL